MDAYDHQLAIARKTLKMNDVMANVMGGMTKAEAKVIVNDHNKKHSKSQKQFKTRRK